MLITNELNNKYIENLTSSASSASSLSSSLDPDVFFTNPCLEPKEGYLAGSPLGESARDVDRVFKEVARIEEVVDSVFESAIVAPAFEPLLDQLIEILLEEENRIEEEIEEAFQASREVMVEYLILEAIAVLHREDASAEEPTFLATASEYIAYGASSVAAAASWAFQSLASPINAYTNVVRAQEYRMLAREFYRDTSSQ